MERPTLDRDPWAASSKCPDWLQQSRHGWLLAQKKPSTQQLSSLGWGRAQGMKLGPPLPVLVLFYRRQQWHCDGIKGTECFECPKSWRTAMRVPGTAFGNCNRVIDLCTVAAPAKGEPQGGAERAGTSALFPASLDHASNLAGCMALFAPSQPLLPASICAAGPGAQHFTLSPHHSIPTQTEGRGDNTTASSRVIRGIGRGLTLDRHRLLQTDCEFINSVRCFQLRPSSRVWQLVFASQTVKRSSPSGQGRNGSSHWACWLRLHEVFSVCTRSQSGCSFLF